MTNPRSTTEVVLKVTLKGRRVWRSIAMRGDQTLEHLHEAIFSAFGRFDDHLYSFYFPKTPRRRGPMTRTREYVSPWSYGDSGPSDRTFDAGSTVLDSLDLKVGQSFEYLFDYGDSWWHDIEVTGLGRVVAGRRYPIVLEKRGRSPEQYPDVE
jgi:hypothetical protein